MSSRKNNSINIKKYKRKREMNIGIFIFTVVLIYLIVTVVLYATNKKISIYEVREGSILKDTSYTGLVLRKEEIVNAEESGYINYYQNENSKIRTGSNTYAITQQQLSYDTATAEGTLSNEEQNSLVVKTQSFNQNFNPQKFSSVYSLKSEITNIMQDASNQTKTTQLDMILGETQSAASVFQATKDGVMVFNVDGYESLNAESFSKKNFDRSKYNMTSLTDNMQVEKGDPAYKLISSDRWSVVFDIDKEAAKTLADVTEIKTRIDKDNETLWADFSILHKQGGYYGMLNYSDSMIRYAEERFLNVELITEDESGLKIPKSSVIEEEFYVIPEEYITTGGNSNNAGVMVQKKGGDFSFLQTEIYRMADGKAYLSASSLKKGTVIVKPESSETALLSSTKKLKGVYNINKGYAVFRQVTILAESDEYYIVQDGETYGLYNYDHIVQDGSTVHKDEVVF